MKPHDFHHPFDIHRQDAIHRNMTITLDSGALVEAVARELADSRGSSGIVRLIVQTAGGTEAVLIAGRDFALDGELAARIERIVGEGKVELGAQEPPKLALVG